MVRSIANPGPGEVTVRIAFLGLGLIGGSIARALREPAVTGPFARAELTAWTPTGLGPAEALRAGIIDRVARSVADAVTGADLVVLAAPPLEILGLLDRLAGPDRESLGAATIVTDVASTKSAIVSRAVAAGLRFVGGHPMAGREASGFGAGDTALLRGRPWVVADDPTADAAAIELVEGLAAACGALPVRMTAAAHDAATAAVSHLPLIAAVALVEAVVGAAGAPDRDDWPQAAGLAATGWASATRLARGDVSMGAGIAVTNAPDLAARLRDYRDAIDGWIAALEAPGGPDVAELAWRLRSARDRLAG